MGKEFISMSDMLKNTFVRVAILVFVLFFVFMFVVLRLENNEKMVRVDEMQKQLESLDEYISELEAKINKPFDDQYVADVAHDKLGMRYPEEVIFYSGECN